MNKLSSVNSDLANIRVQNLTQCLYGLRKAFVKEHYCSLRYEKYEEAREFTIRLNNTIFDANRSLQKETVSLKVVIQLEHKFNMLLKDLSTVIS